MASNVISTPHQLTAVKLLDACEQLLCEAATADDVTVRRVAEHAGVNVSAIAYHFGSREKLIVAVAHRVYHRLNAERLRLLQRAIERRAPEPPLLEDMIVALVGPSVRWSLDATSSYPVLWHLTSMALLSRDRGIYREIDEDVEHHRAFIAHFRAAAPWLSPAEVGWRVSCALGIRSQAIRQRPRNEVLTNHQIDFDDPEVVIANMVAVIAPMFMRPPPLFDMAEPRTQTLS